MIFQSYKTLNTEIKSLKKIVNIYIIKTNT